jgi:hypothetical protein
MSIDYVHKGCQSCPSNSEMRIKYKRVNGLKVKVYEVYCFAEKAWVGEMFSLNACSNWGKSISSFTIKVPSEVISTSKMNPNRYFIDEDIEESEGL